MSRDEWEEFSAACCGIPLFSSQERQVNDSNQIAVTIQLRVQTHPYTPPERGLKQDPLLGGAGGWVVLTVKHYPVTEWLQIAFNSY